MWIRAAKKENRNKYYEMVFVYVDDILSLSHKTKVCIKGITLVFRKKQDSVKAPEIYLGADISKMKLPDEREVWATSPRTYVINVIQVVELILVNDDKRFVLKSKVINLFPSRST